MIIAAIQTKTETYQMPIDGHQWFSDRVVLKQIMPDGHIEDNAFYKDDCITIKMGDMVLWGEAQDEKDN